MTPKAKTPGNTDSKYKRLFQTQSQSLSTSGKHLTSTDTNVEPVAKRTWGLEIDIPGAKKIIPRRKRGKE